MLAQMSDWIVPAAFLGGAATLFLGVMFLFAPEKALVMTKHHADKLPLIMTGRYFFMTLMAVGAALSQDLSIIAFVFVGLGGIALFDALVYLSARRAVIPHFGAAVLAFGVAALAYGARS